MTNPYLCHKQVTISYLYLISHIDKNDIIVINTQQSCQYGTNMAQISIGTAIAILDEEIDLNKRKNT